jgi:hypothetical protein
MFKLLSSHKQEYLNRTKHKNLLTINSVGVNKTELKHAYFLFYHISGVVIKFWQNWFKQ